MSNDLFIWLVFDPWTSLMKTYEKTRLTNGLKLLISKHGFIGSREFRGLNLMVHGHIHRFWRTVAECLCGRIALILATLACFLFRLDLPMSTCLYLMVIVLVSVRSGYLSAAIISVIAAGCLDYFFLPPVFSLELSRPAEYVALATFLTTSLELKQAADGPDRFGQSAAPKAMA